MANEKREISMRVIKTHQVDDANRNIELIADDLDATNGGASHVYTIRVKNFGGGEDSNLVMQIDFQRGPLKEAQPNGLTEHVLLAILIDRLQSFQAGPFSCRENALMLTKLEEAQHWAIARTRARELRGVEGQNKL